MKQKIVIKLSMPNDKSRAKAMEIISGVAGVISMAISGDLKDRLEVIGDGVDAVGLVSCLRRKKLGDGLDAVCLVSFLSRKQKFDHAEILSVEEVKDKKKEEKKLEEKKDENKPPPCCCPGYPCYLHPRPLPMVVCEEPPANPCSIM